MVQIVWAVLSPSHHVVMIIPVYDVRRGEQFFFDRRGRRRGPLSSWFEEVRYIEDYAIGHQGSLNKASKDIGGVVLVVGDAGQTRVEGHHEEGELQ